MSPPRLLAFQPDAFDRVATETDITMRLKLLQKPGIRTHTRPRARGTY